MTSALFLRGDLGAGKTTLVKGIAQALDAADPDEVTSPTFTLVHESQLYESKGMSLSVLAIATLTLTVAAAAAGLIPALNAQPQPIHRKL